MSDLCHKRAVKRPAVDEVHRELQRWGGIIVHFSGVPPGVSAGAGLTFPADLQHVIAGNAQKGIACSTVKPGDVFEITPTYNYRNSWGCIGVVVRSQHPWSLVGATPHDGGSSVPPGSGGFRYCAHSNTDLRIQEVIDSLAGRSPSGPNEWVLRDYEVLGVLIQPPLSVHALGMYATWPQIVAAFPNQKFYTIEPNGLFEVDPGTTQMTPAGVAALYP